MQLHILSILALLASSIMIQAEPQLRGTGHTIETKTSRNIYHITLFRGLQQAGDGSFFNVDEIVSTPVVNGADTYHFYDIDLPKEILSEYEDLLVAGDLYIETRGSAVVNDNAVVLDKDSVISVLDESRRPQRRKLASNGIRTAAAVRVSMTSGETVEYSKAEIEHQLFEKPEVSLKEQLNKCSNGKIMIQSAGVYEVTVQGKVADYSSPAAIRNEALKVFAEQQKVASAGDFADHVMVMIPVNNFSNFVGTGSTGGWLSTLNNQWSLDVTVYLHEIG